jgi:hypothetical protein
MSSAVALVLVLLGVAKSGEQLVADARATVRRHCTPCHDGQDDASKPPALAVFDVQSSRWYAGMSAEQLGSATRRVAGAADGPEAAAFRAFVRAELERRAASP